MPKITSTEEMKKNYEAEIPYMAKNWELGKEKAIKADAWCKAIEEITGKSCNDVLNEKWKDRLGAISGDDFKKILEEKKAAERMVKNWEKKVTKAE